MINWKIVIFSRFYEILLNKGYSFGAWSSTLDSEVSQTTCLT